MRCWLAQGTPAEQRNAQNQNFKAGCVAQKCWDAEAGFQTFHAHQTEIHFTGKHRPALLLSTGVFGLQWQTRLCLASHPTPAALCTLPSS
jgi:hypothetical protein